MEIENFLYLLDDPNRITENDLNQLEDLVAEYPYFQIAHILIAKGTQNRKSVLAPQKVRRAATYAYDRNFLRKMIEEDYNHVLKAATNQKQHTQILEPQPIPDEFVENDSFTQYSSDKFELENQETSLETEQVELQNDSTNTDNFTSENEVIATDLENTLPTQMESKYSDVDNNLVNSLNQGELTEGLAMDLFNEGKINEAVYVYEELIKANPNRKDYFVSQVRVLTDDDTYDFDISNLSIPDNSEIESIQPELETETKDEEIQVISFSEIENPEEEAPITLEGETQEDTLEVSTEEEDVLENSTSEFSEVGITENLNQHTEEETTTEVKEEIISPTLPETAAEENTVTDLSQDNTSEILALTYQQKEEFGKALEIYKNLLEENPDRKNYYGSKIQELELLLKNQNQDVNTTQDIPMEMTSPVSFEEEEGSKETINILDDSITETLALTYYQKGEVQKSIDIYQKLLIKYPDRESYYDGRIRELEDELKAQNESQISLTDLNPNELSTETKSFFDSLDEDLEKIEDSQQESSISEKKAIQLFNEKRYQEAIAVYELLIAQDAEKADYYLKQIDVLKQEQDYQQKVTEIKEEDNSFTTDVVSSNDEVSDSKAMSLYGEGKIQEAIAMYQILIQEDPNKKSYYESQLSILSEGNINNIAASSSIDSPKLEHQNNDNNIDENTAMNLFIEGRVEEAVKVYEQLINIHPDRADYFRKQIEVLKSE